MVNKYYTPEIDEFPYGQEYQKRINGKWKNYFTQLHGPIDKTEPFNSIKKDLRIKYLDKKDIEYFGFVYNKKKSTNVFSFFSLEKEYWDLYYSYTIQMCDLRGSFVEKISVIIKRCIVNLAGGESKKEAKFETVFYGNIKNKWELAKVLKQTNLKINGKIN